jgi:heavy metal sensor kinase
VPPLPGGLRTRLALTISLLILGVVGVAFVAVDRATRAELEGRVDDELAEQYAEFEQAIAGKALDDPGELERAARSFVVSQRYHAESRIFVIEVDGDRQVTSHPELIEREIKEAEDGGDGREGDDGPALLGAPEGLSDVSTGRTGDLRVLSEPILRDGTPVGTFRVADPLENVGEAQEGMRNAFLIVGLAAIAVALVAATLAANRITAPLRRMTRVAADVDAGDLSPRFDVETGDEVERLAHSFNGMLDRLERAFERERGFVSDASHELRTPLTVLRGQVEMLERIGEDPRERGEIASALEREIARMSRLVDEMLTLARADDDRLLQPRPIDLADFLADLERDMPLLGDRDFRIDGDRTGTLVADPERLSQVFRNLVRNAVQHTGPGGRIKVSVRAHPQEIEFSVTDDGPGIPPDELASVFERFHRVDSGRSRDEGGSGLGLAIARAIVEAHGGRIWAESAPGAGASLFFVLPRAPQS